LQLIDIKKYKSLDFAAHQWRLWRGRGSLRGSFTIVQKLFSPQPDRAQLGWAPHGCARLACVPPGSG
jgi:hypothetical protein